MNSGLRPSAGLGMTPRTLPRAKPDQLVDELPALLEFGDADELVRLVRLVDIARSAHHRRDAGGREQAAFGAIGHLAVAVAAGELLGELRDFGVGRRVEP